MAVGGAQKFLVSLVNSLDIEIFTILVISLSGRNALQSEVNEHIMFIPLPRNRKIDRKTIFTLRNILLDFEPHCVFCLGAYPFFIVNVASFFSNRFKKIISYHITVPLNGKQDKLHKLYFSLLKKKDIIITVSKNQEIYTARRYKVPENKFKTIHNGIDINQWTLPTKDFSRTNLRANYGLLPDSKVIIIAANLRPEKNHLGAIESLKILHDTHKLMASLLIVGDGVVLDKLKELVAQTNLSSYVIFTGEQKDVRPFYWISDLFTLTSKKVETFSIAALEAMACGLPAVLTDIGGANEMIVEKLNGLLCSPDETDISEKWYAALTMPFDNVKISQDIHKKFNHTDMVTKYETILIK